MDFRDLYERHAPAVRRFALFLCGDAMMADDITSDTFMRAWLARARIEQPTVKSYLFAIARHAYYDIQRRSRRQSSLDEKRADPQIGMQAHLEQKEEMQCVIAALQQLPEIDRTALLMRALDDMPYEEIATALTIPVATAKVKVHRARAKLMQARSVARESSTFSGDRK